MKKFLFQHFPAGRKSREYTPASLFLLSPNSEFFNTSHQLYPIWILSARELSDVTHIGQLLGIQSRVEGGSDKEKEWYLASTPFHCGLCKILSLIFIPFQENQTTINVLKIYKMSKKKCYIYHFQCSLFHTLSFAFWDTHSFLQFLTFKKSNYMIT